MSYDLDPADRAEVRLRVVDPVLAAMFTPGELTSVMLGFGAPPDIARHGSSHGAGDGLWFTAIAGDDTYQHAFDGLPGHVDADDTARELADGLQGWFCETKVGWGQLRRLPDGWRAPGPTPAPPGARVLVIAPSPRDGGFPLWEGTEPADASALGLSPGLLADLRAFQELCDSEPGDSEPGDSEPGDSEPGDSEAARQDAEEPAWLPDAPPPGSGVWLLSAEEALLREQAEARAAAAEHQAWRSFVADVESLRDALVERLRAELGPGFHVPTPPRIP